MILRKLLEQTRETLRELQEETRTDWAEYALIVIDGSDEKGFDNSLFSIPMQQHQ